VQEQEALAVKGIVGGGLIHPGDEEVPSPGGGGGQGGNEPVAGIVFNLQGLPLGFVRWQSGGLRTQSPGPLKHLTSTCREVNRWAGSESTETNLWDLPPGECLLPG
jgi:hypothetical protein